MWLAILDDFCVEGDKVAELTAFVLRTEKRSTDWEADESKQMATARQG